MALSYIDHPSPDRKWKKGNAQLLILSLLEPRPRHRCQISERPQRRLHLAP